MSSDDSEVDGGRVQEGRHGRVRRGGGRGGHWEVHLLTVLPGGFFLHFFFQVDFNQHILTFLQFLSQSSIFSERMLQISIFQLSVPSMAVEVHKFCITTFPIIFGGGSKSIWMSYTTFSLSGSVAKSRNVTQLHSRGRFC